MQERNTSTSEKNRKTNFIKPRQISGTPSYGTSAFFSWKELSHNLASNSKKKLKTAYFLTAAKCPNFQTPKSTSKKPFTQLVVCWFLPIFCPFRERTTTPPQSLSMCSSRSESWFLPNLTHQGWVCLVTADELIHFLYLSPSLGISDLIQLVILLLYKPNTSFCHWGFLLLLPAADSC